MYVCVYVCVCVIKEEQAGGYENIWRNIKKGRDAALYYNLKNKK